MQINKTTKNSLINACCDFIEDYNLSKNELYIKQNDIDIVSHSEYMEFQKQENKILENEKNIKKEFINRIINIFDNFEKEEAKKHKIAKSFDDLIDMINKDM